MSRTYDTVKCVANTHPHVIPTIPTIPNYQFTVCCFLWHVPGQWRHSLCCVGAPRGGGRDDHVARASHGLLLIWISPACNFFHVSMLHCTRFVRHCYSAFHIACVRETCGASATSYYLTRIQRYLTRYLLYAEARNSYGCPHQYDPFIGRALHSRAQAASSSRALHR